MPGFFCRRLRLENFIFAWAARLGAPVDGVNGRLKSPCPEPYLQISLYLYNQCFAVAVNEEMSYGTRWPFGGVKNGWLLPGPFVCPGEGNRRVSGDCSSIN